MKLKKIISLLLLTVFCSLSTIACSKSSNNTDDVNLTSGQNIYEIAKDFSEKFPNREIGSSVLVSAGEYIKEKLSNMGYDVQEENVTADTKNIIASFKGQGFSRTSEDAKDQRGIVDENLYLGDFNKTVIFVASYDTSLSMNEEIADYKFQGFSDNASGVATLLELANELKNIRTGYDVKILFTIGGQKKQLGAQKYLESLDSEEISKIATVIDVHRIYAGNKLYAHAGRSSLLDGQKYKQREALYLFLDLFSLEQIYKQYNVNILTNQNSFKVKVPGYSKEHLYREFSLNDSNYLAFDEKNIPIIYIDSGEYRMTPNDNFKENTASFFNKTNYMVSGTNFDNIEVINNEVGEDRLIKRGQALIHLFKEYLKTGLINAKIKK